MAAFYLGTGGANSRMARSHKHSETICVEFSLRGPLCFVEQLSVPLGSKGGRHHDAGKSIGGRSGWMCTVSDRDRSSRAVMCRSVSTLLVPEVQPSTINRQSVRGDGAQSQGWLWLRKWSWSSTHRGSIARHPVLKLLLRAPPLCERPCEQL